MFTWKICVVIITSLRLGEVVVRFVVEARCRSEMPGPAQYDQVAGLHSRLLAWCEARGASIASGRSHFPTLSCCLIPYGEGGDGSRSGQSFANFGDYITRKISTMRPIFVFPPSKSTRLNQACNRRLLSPD